jgi:RNA-directed DNA polymerase
MRNKMEKEITYYKQKIQELKSRSDLTELLNEVVKDLFPDVDNLKPIRLTSINYYSLPNNQKRNYKEFSIKKKNGGERKINTPVRGLKYIQRCITYLLEQVYNPHPYACGFIKGRSIIDNAKVHVNRNYVYNVDVKNFFPGIELHRIKTVLTFKPFEFPENIAFTIANICTINDDNGKAVLPQGAPTSPILSNIICKRLDKQLSLLSRDFQCKYSRYADDITFSSSRNVFSSEEFQKHLTRIISENKFELKESKTRLQHREYRQMVTGIVVNEKLNVRKTYIRSVRAMLNNWEKLGYEKANEKFQEHYIQDKGHVKKSRPELLNVLAGKLDYISMVRGKEDFLVKKYWNQFMTVSLNKEMGMVPGMDLEQILDIWENDGIEKAMEKTITDQ